jgi:hypothetical protein
MIMGEYFKPWRRKIRVQATSCDESIDPTSATHAEDRSVIDIVNRLMKKNAGLLVSAYGTALAFTPFCLLIIVNEYCEMGSPAAEFFDSRPVEICGYVIGYIGGCIIIAGWYLSFRSRPATQKKALDSTTEKAE